MTKNMSKPDRIIRVLLAAVFVILYFTKMVSGTFAIVLLALAGIFVLTSLVSFCPLYKLLGINTCSKKQKSYEA